jgi:hypothetical protein
MSLANTIQYHAGMIADRTRVVRFREALFKSVKKGDVVLDIGTGTGIMAYFACQAGAKKVYAVESGPIIELAKSVCAKNGLTNKIEFIAGTSTSINLPEKANVLVTETIGTFGVNEGLFENVLDARKRLLTPDAKIIPGQLALIAAPVTKSDSPVLDPWEKPTYKIDWAAAREYSSNLVYPLRSKPSQLLAKPAILSDTSLPDFSESKIRAHQHVTIRKAGIVHGLSGWFSSLLAPGVKIANPPGESSSWAQLFLPLENPLKVRKGEVLSVKIEIGSDGMVAQWSVERETGKPYHEIHTNPFGYL